MVFISNYNHTIFGFLSGCASLARRVVSLEHFRCLFPATLLQFVQLFIGLSLRRGRRRDDHQGEHEQPHGWLGGESDCKPAGTCLRRSYRHLSPRRSLLAVAFYAVDLFECHSGMPIHPRSNAGETDFLAFKERASYGNLFAAPRERGN